METETRTTTKRGSNVLLNLLFGAIIGTITFTVIGLLIPHTYTATATLLFPGARSSGPASTASGEASDTGGGGSGSDQPSLPLMQGVLSVPQPGTSPSTAYLILTSRKVTLELINEFKLEEHWGLSRQRTLNRFKDRFICASGNSGDLRIAFRDNDRDRAIKLTEAAVTKLKDAVKELSLDPAAQNAEYMSMSLHQAEADCEKDQKALIDFQHAVGGAAPDTQVTLLGQTYGEIQKNLVNARSEADAALANLRSSTQMGEKMLNAAMDPKNSGNALITSLYKTVVDRESELALLRERYTDKQPDVVKAKQALGVAKHELDAEVKRQLNSLYKGASPYVSDAIAADLSAMARVKGLEQASTEAKDKLNALTEAQVKYGELSLRLRDDRSRLTLVRSEYVKAQLIKESRGPQFVILDEPDAPVKANEFDLYYFTLFGLGLGIVLVLLKELFSRMKSAMKSMGF